jgi:hypothetical protein
MKQQAAPYVISKYDPLTVISEECPRAAELLAEYGLHCANCFANGFETLEVGAQMHNMTDEETMEMIDEINTQLEKEWREENK